MIHVRPVNGARVLDPDAVPAPDALPADGKMVVDKPFWRRRLKAKEVELVKAPATKTAKTTRAKKAATATPVETQAPTVGPEPAQAEESREE
jgi:hypothetical protein